MSDYNLLLTGNLNLYNVGLSVVAVGGLGSVGTLLSRAMRDGEVVPSERRIPVALAAIPIVLGIAVFVFLAVGPPVDGVPTWGPFYLLPALFLAGVCVLAAFRPTQAATTLAIAAAVAFLAQVALGITAGRLDPTWIRDGLDRGSLAVTVLVFGFPAMLTAIILLTWASPAGEAPWMRTRVGRG